VVWCCGGAGREGAKEKMASASKRTEGEKLAWVGGGDLKKKGGGGRRTGSAWPCRSEWPNGNRNRYFWRPREEGPPPPGRGVDMRWVVSRRW
jgi:hypothetical protein